jgi:hypothetical protein
LPTTYGEKTSKTIAIASLLIFVCITLFNPTMEFNLRIALISSGLISIPMIYLTNKDRGDAFFAFGVEGLMLVQLAFVILATF